MATRAPDHQEPPAAGSDTGLDGTRRRLAALLARGAVRAAAQGAGARVKSHRVGGRSATPPSGRNEETEFTES